MAAGLLIAFAAPPVGMVPILVWFAMGQGEFSLSYVPLQSALPASYMAGGIQGLLAGMVVGWGIHRRGWIGLEAWMALTVGLALASISVLMLIGNEPGKSGLIYISNVSIACYLVAAALFASLVLRWVIMALGLMRRR